MATECQKKGTLKVCRTRDGSLEKVPFLGEKVAQNTIWRLNSKEKEGMGRNKYPTEIINLSKIISNKIVSEKWGTKASDNELYFTEATEGALRK